MAVAAQIDSTQEVSGQARPETVHPAEGTASQAVLTRGQVDFHPAEGTRRQEEGSAADSVAQDSAAVVLPACSWNIEGEADCPYASAREVLLCSQGVEGNYLHGIEPQARPLGVARDSGLLAALTIMFLLVAFNFRSCARMFKAMSQDLWSVRRRENAFDDHTANETRVMLVMLLQLWLCEGLLLYFWGESQGYIPMMGWVHPIAFTGALALGFYIFQLLAYKVVGYAFSDAIGASQWVRGYNSSQAFLGVGLVIPAVVIIFYPGAAEPMLWTGAGLYVLARITFIIKGFRIFYHNFSSLLYFILYLCALEIIPILLLGLAIISLGPIVE
ncbi:MAG: DUF4271 domain-containing protein [Bacteroidales bacterium]|nr:DUF4271 domain-containing protein [Bacteroidales bacterium]